MAHVFISYAREDGDYARSLASALRAGGVAVWFDETIDTGRPYPREIEDAVEASAAVVVLMSDAGRDSDWVSSELEQARSEGTLILPLLVSGRRWGRLAAMQYLDVSDGSMPPTSFVERLRNLAPAETAQPTVPERLSQQEARRGLAEAILLAHAEEAGYDLAGSIERALHALPEPPLDDLDDLTDAYVWVRVENMPEVTVRSGWANPAYGRRRAGRVYVAAVLNGRLGRRFATALDGRRWTDARKAAEYIANAFGTLGTTASVDLVDPDPAPQP